MPYVDGFVLAVPTNKIEEYKQLARTRARNVKEYGALSYIGMHRRRRALRRADLLPPRRPCQGQRDRRLLVDRLREPRGARTRSTKVMADPRLQTDPSTMPFDGKRMGCPAASRPCCSF